MSGGESAARPLHVPVLVEEVVGLLVPERGGTIVDGTVGLGGHSEALLRANPRVRIIGIDRDLRALDLACERLAPFRGRVELMHGNYADVAIHLRQLGVSTVDGVLLDLGVSSIQLDDAARGFGFRLDGPLDMRMDPSSGPTAAQWLAAAGVDELAWVLGEYGEERYARRIARAIVEARGRAPIETTSRLVEIIHRAVPGAYFAERIDPATRTFQALRIRANDELLSLERGLREGFQALAPGGVFAVISFHSLEDRRVKTFFRERAAACVCPPDLPECRCGKRVEAEILTKRPIVPSALELERNPRARSAKLRAARRVT